jgi:hypothetical protein
MSTDKWSLEKLVLILEKLAKIAVDAKVIADGLGRIAAGFDDHRFNVPFAYAECADYFASHKNDDPKIVKGAILRAPALKGKTEEKCWEFFLVFLDNDNNLVCDGKGVPIGFKTLRSKADEELEKTFGDKDLVIVE